MNGIEPEECFHTVQIRIGRGGRSQVKCKPFCTHFSYRNEIQKPNSKTKTQLNSKSKKKKMKEKKMTVGCWEGCLSFCRMKPRDLSLFPPGELQHFSTILALAPFILSRKADQNPSKIYILFFCFLLFWF